MRDLLPSRLAWIALLLALLGLALVVVESIRRQGREDGAERHGGTISEKQAMEPSRRVGDEAVQPLEKMGTAQSTAHNAPGYPAPATPQEPKAPQTKRVILDPGHGGADPGTRSRIKIDGKTLYEKSLTLNIALEAQRLLERVPHVTPLLTRTADVHVPKTDRVRFVQRSRGDIFVSIHANSTQYHSQHPSVRGVTIYSFGDDSDPAVQEKEAEEDRFGQIVSRQAGFRLLPNLTAAGRAIRADALNRQTEAARESMRKSFTKDFYYGQFKVRVYQAPYKVLANGVMPALLIEVGYMDVAREMRHLGKPDFQKHIALLIANGILDYLASQDPGFAYEPIVPE